MKLKLIGAFKFNENVPPINFILNFYLYLIVQIKQKKNIQTIEKDKFQISINHKMFLTTIFMFRNRIY
ncbi:hypothetical protein BpHYR1_002987 [Brachionus plicatilis]|uniref:Uncharacterized protein n=1 Tax=Brachionus plicatilis TaxID=10195 RepID=A0A3M7RUX0_BRAPC|nr:hypothetical protein BpHYR1_002987 [Brachionus plicatilis]